MAYRWIGLVMVGLLCAGGPVSDAQALESAVAGDGLKEALKVGIRTAVEKVGQEDGFLKNPDIRIPLPSALQKIEPILKTAGAGEMVENLKVKMNRAAEKAAPEALDIFVGAIKALKIEDAMGLLKGGETAATDYLREKTADDLQEAFYPTVKETMAEVNAVQTYQSIMDQHGGGIAETAGQLGALAKATGMGDIGETELDVNAYVTEKAINGLFVMVGREEAKIRENPAARATDLLKSVFGSLTQ